jgi:hypothetical protein
MDSKKLKADLFSYALITCVLIMSGCAEQQQYGEVEQICVPGMDKAGVMQLAEDVLADMYFTIDKADPDTGFIRTNPLPGAQFFEFWRKDNVGPENATLANLHSIRRIVELNINRDRENLRIDCDAQVYRLSLPRRQSTSSARAYKMFTKGTKSVQALQLHPQQQADAAWVSLGRDKPLETEILEQIEKRLKRLR